jgi:hypothetical protein
MTRSMLACVAASIVLAVSVYALEGPGTRCILAAGTGQPDGKSEALACQPSDEPRALVSELIGNAEQGTVDVVWTGSSPQDVSAQAGGRSLAVQTGSTLVAVKRPDPNTAGSITWTAAGQPQSFEFVTAQELEAQRREVTASTTPAP